MVQPLCSPARLAGAALFFFAFALSFSVSACGVFSPPSGEQEDDGFSHRAYTVWHPLASTEGAMPAFALEPRRVDADEHGVMITGWHGQVPGDGVIARPSGSGAPDVIGTAPRGLLDTDWDDAHAYVWTKDLTEWTPVAPNDEPPAARYTSVTWLDRASFEVQGSRTFDPPLEGPFAVGSLTLIDTPATKESDVARDVRIAVVDLATGGTEVVLAARAFATATCPRASGAVVAYQPEDAPDETIVLDVAVDPNTRHAAVARGAIADLAPTSVVCRASGDAAAVLGLRWHERTPRGVVVRRDDEGSALAVAVDGAFGEPAALSRDGRTLLAKRNEEMVLARAEGVKVLAGVVAGSAGWRRPTLAVSGDRAAVAEYHGVAIVALDDPSAAPLAIAAAPDDDIAPYAGADGTFVLFETHYDCCGVKAGDPLVAASIVDAAGVTSIDLGPAVEPVLAYADRERAYAVVDRGDAVELVTIDMHAHTVAGRVPFPLCDQDAMKSRARCLP